MARGDRYEYPIRDLTCQDCGAGFRARHGRLCRPCRYKAECHPCASCGVPVGPRARRCNACNGVTRSGPGSHRWQGGRHLDGNGYMKVWAPDHPEAKLNYVAEHRKVMGEMLGRGLLPGETVHHRNGVKTDNRPENLELWVKPQPAGQRAVDLLAWAHEIVDTYEPLREVITATG